MSRRRDRPFVFIAALGTLAVALALSGCGRKGPLDPPPGASLAGEPQPNMPDIIGPTPKRSPAPPTGQTAQAKPPKTPKKHFFLDDLLN